MTLEAFLDPIIVRRVIGTLILLAAAVILSRIGRRLARATFDEQERQYRAAKYLNRVIWIIAVSLGIALWSPSAGNLFTVLTIIGAGLAVALRDVLLSFVGWINLSLHPPYRPGDRIEVNNIQGDVVDVGLLQTTLLEIGEWVEANQSTGRLVHVPNAWIFQHGIKNYTEGFSHLWMEQSFTVTFESDWRDARDIILEAAQDVSPDVEKKARRELQRMTSEYLVQFNVLTPYVYVSLAENGVKLTLRELTPARGIRGIRHTLTMDVLDRFHDHGSIHLAYPTVRVSGASSPLPSGSDPA